MTCNHVRRSTASSDFQKELLCALNVRICPDQLLQMRHGMNVPCHAVYDPLGKRRGNEFRKGILKEMSSCPDPDILLFSRMC